jgi:hypothetical protein
VLANLLYWRESAAALGEERFARLVKLADEFAKNGVAEFGSIPS